MPSITEAATIRSDPGTLWREIGGFGSGGSLAVAPHHSAA